MSQWWMRKKKKTKETDLFGNPIRKKSKPDLVKELDKVFAYYIRLRDVMPSGYGRCISCGKILPFSELDCGHFHSRRHMGTRFHEDNCNAECKHCLTPDALVLTADLLWVRLGELKVGDKIVSFEEERSRAQARLWKKGTITHIHFETQDVYDVELENGDHIKTTAEHKWLARKRCNSNYNWVMTKDLWFNGHNVQGKRKTGPHTDKTFSVVCKPFLVIHQDKSYESGWLAGMIDADGHICQQNIHNQDGTLRYGFRIGVAQCNKYPSIQSKIIELIERFTDNKKPCRQSLDNNLNKKIKSKYELLQFLVTGTNIEKLHFLMKVRPNKMNKVDIDKLGMIRSRYDTKVVNVSYIGKQTIVVMETDTHTFIANGYAMHNCNRISSDHIIKYRDNLIDKIGMGRYDTLKLLAATPKHWLDSELEEKIDYYKKEVRRLSAEKGIKVNL